MAVHDDIRHRDVSRFEIELRSRRGRDDDGKGLVGGSGTGVGRAQNHAVWPDIVGARQPVQGPGAAVAGHCCRTLYELECRGIAIQVGKGRGVSIIRSRAHEQKRVRGEHWRGIEGMNLLSRNADTAVVVVDLESHSVVIDLLENVSDQRTRRPGVISEVPFKGQGIALRIGGGCCVKRDRGLDVGRVGRDGQSNNRRLVGRSDGYVEIVGASQRGKYGQLWRRRRCWPCHRPSSS